MSSEEVILRRLKGFVIGISPSYSKLEPQLLLELVFNPAKSQQSVLGGRGSVGYSNLEGVGRVVIKCFRRGGLLGLIVRKIYLRLGKVRSQLEFETLNQVRSFGVNAPEPVAFIRQGGFFYRTWLITKEIEQKDTLADLSLRDEDAARNVMKELVRQVNLLMDNNIHHIDLHPGNVLVTRENKVFILDFDKAAFFGGPRSLLRDKYIFRWRRAVIKHRLPEVLTEMICLGLRTNEA